MLLVLRLYRLFVMVSHSVLIILVTEKSVCPIDDVKMTHFIVCNDETYTCDEQVVSAPSPNTDSPNLENSPLSFTIVSAPILIVLAATIVI